MPARLPPIAALLALALAVAGCAPSSGGGDSAGKFQGEQRLVANAVEDLQSAGAKGDQDAICADLLAADVVDRLDARGGCRKVVDGALKDADTFDLTVESVRVSGTTASARVKTETGSKDRVETLRLVKERGRWRIAELG